MRKHNMETARSHRGLPFDPFDQLVPRNYDPAAVLEHRKVFVIPDSTFDHTEKLLSDYFIKLPSIYLIPDGHNRKNCCWEDAQVPTVSIPKLFFR